MVTALAAAAPLLDGWETAASFWPFLPRVVEAALVRWLSCAALEPIWRAAVMTALRSSPALSGAMGLFFRGSWVV